MGLKEGTLQSLIDSGPTITTESLGDLVLHHMLQAIDYLAAAGVVHRDLKPENILYTSQNGSYCFQLGDFGLCNRIKSAVTFAGSEMYMAPEMFISQKQTHKMDVWSLFVTILWTLDWNQFRERARWLKGPQDTVELVTSSAASLPQIEDMAKFNPEERASAAQMLAKLYNERGLSADRDPVEPLLDPTNADRIAPASTRPVVRPGVPRKVTISMDPYRVAKPRPQFRRPSRPAMEMHRGLVAVNETPPSRPIPGAFPADPIDYPTDPNQRRDFT